MRHCVRVVPHPTDPSCDGITGALDRVGGVVIVVAYVISVALYLPILARYVFHIAGGDSAITERALAIVLIGVILGVGITRGFRGLDVLERSALIAVLVIVTVLIIVLLTNDIRAIHAGGLRLPPSPPAGLGRILLTLGGVVITVQGFETVRYLGEEYDATTRIWASRIAQIVATVIYLALVAVATP